MPSQRLQTFYSGQRGSQTPKNGAVPDSGARGLIVIRRRPKPPVGRRLNDKMAEESLPPAHSPVVDLVRNLVRKRDFYAGGLIIFFGLVMALKGPGYRLGTLMHMKAIGTCPATTALSAGPAPLKGTGWMSSLSAYLKFSAARLAVVPKPGEAKLTLPGLA